MEAQKILRDFLPDRLFDAHAHLYHSAYLPHLYPAGSEPKQFGLVHYHDAMRSLLGFSREFALNIITFPGDERMADEQTGLLKAADDFLLGELDKDGGNIGEILVMPGETLEHIQSRMTHRRICGFKCYHTLYPGKDTMQLDIEQFLPEAAWQLADQRHLAITLHMVKDAALADEKNLSYIRAMAERYPNAVLILAHAARAFASWTGVETVEKIADLDNVWYDLAAVCESPAIYQIFHKTGTKRCMWGSDYPISCMKGKAISLADKFYWLYDKEYQILPGSPRPWTIGIENFMAIRQACLMADLSEDQVEDVFYNNAAELFYGICGKPEGKEAK